MDTVIGNKYIGFLNTLNIEVSKKLEGEYDVDEIISTFGNFFFNKMFLDITSIKNYKDLTNLQKLSMSINMDRVILLLDKDDAISDSDVFLSRLVSLGIYNFTKDENNLMYLYNNPNTYRDVAQYQEIDKEEVDVTTPISQDNPNKILLGVKSITDDAGSTTLIYMLKKVLQEYLNVVGVELNKNEFNYFNDNELISIKEDLLEQVLNKYSSADIFLIDLNKSSKSYMCNEVLYLIEPSIIKVNEMLMINRNLSNELRGKKVILNKCMLDDNGIANFEVNSNIKSFYIIPPLDDTKDNSDVLRPLLEKLGYIEKIEEEEIVEEKPTRKSIFNLFK